MDRHGQRSFFSLVPNTIMSYYLFLDDKRNPDGVNWVKLPDVQWLIARNYLEFTEILRTHGLPKMIAYDCDLCSEHYEALEELKGRYILHYPNFKAKCGIHCAEHVLDLCRKENVAHPQFIIHSLNKYAAEYMQRVIDSFNVGVAYTMDNQAGPDVPSYCTHSDYFICGFFGKYRFLSNFWPAKVRYLGIEFNSVEEAYQAAKWAPNRTKMQEFAGIGSNRAKKLGKVAPIPNMAEWNQKSYKIMYYLVFQKFAENSDLMAMLLDTGTKFLEESNSWKDNKWGQWYVEENGIWKVKETGSNHLGNIIYSVRDALSDTHLK